MFHSAEVIVFVGVIEDMVRDVAVIAVIRVSLVVSLTGVNISVEVTVFEGLVGGVPSSVVASVKADTTDVGNVLVFVGA